MHTTVPIHEVHHNATQHHATSALPAVSMADFKNQGGVLAGREERYDGFQGEPRSVGGGNVSSGNVGSSERSQMGTSGNQMGSSGNQMGTSGSQMGASGLNGGSTE